MEKPMIKEEFPSVKSPEVYEDTSGVFRVFKDFSDSPQTRESSQEALNRLVASFDLEPKEYAPIFEQTSAELKELDQKEARIVAEAQTNLLATIRAWAHKHRMAATLLVAGALHSPIIARSSGFIEKIEQALNAVKDWEKHGAFVMPQSAEEAKKATEQIYERGARVDREKRDAYINELRDKMESGEDVKLNDTYLKLEEVNGVNPEKVKSSERNKNEMIEKFARQMGDDLTEDFIKSVVNDMYGPHENYEWGQGSVTEYFNTGKRNCISIARAEQMVFEALIDRLPADKRSKYELGNAFEKQHEIAILKVLKPDGSIDKTYFLEPPVNALVGKSERLGSPTVSLKAIQTAMVAKNPVTISSNAKPGEIASSPDIITIGNQPVSTNIAIQGDLKGSSYVERIVEEREIEIQWKEPSTTDEIMDLEIIKNEDLQKAKQKIDEAYKFIDANLPRCLNPENCKDPKMIDESVPFVSIDLSSVDWKNLDEKESIEILQELMKVRELPIPDAVKYGNINNVPDSVFWNFFPNHSPSKEMVFDLKADSSGTLNMEKTFQLINRYNSAIKLVENKHKQNIPQIHLQYGDDIYEGALIDILKSFEGGELMLDQKNTIARGQYSDNMVKAMIDSKVNDLYLEGADLIPEVIQAIISNPNKTYHFGLTLYLENLVRRPEIINLPHIKPWVDRVLAAAQLEEVINSLSPDKRASIIPVLEKLERESINKFFRADN